MTALVKDAIAADIATLVRAVDAPTGALGYGRDLSCTTDVTADCAEVDPATTLGIAESTVRRLLTPPGGLPDDPDYGFDVRGLLSLGTDAAVLRTMQGQIVNEVTKDDRIESAEVKVAVVFAPTSLRVTVRIVPADPLLQPFRLVLSVTDAGVLIEELAA